MAIFFFPPCWVFSSSRESTRGTSPIALLDVVPPRLTFVVGALPKKETIQMAKKKAAKKATKKAAKKTAKKSKK